MEPRDIALLSDKIKEAPDKAVVVLPNTCEASNVAVSIALHNRRTDLTFVFPHWLEKYLDGNVRPIVVVSMDSLTPVQNAIVRKAMLKVEVIL